ncbi:MAG: hypothetical protein AAF696_21650 [Bacteroidota bacterium]
MQLYTWFYSLSEALHLEKKAALEADFVEFLSQWKSHGVPVEGMIEIRYGQFIVIKSDASDSRPSGCSIDSLKRSVAGILNKHGLEILDPAHVFYRGEDGKISQSHFRELGALAKAGALHADTIVFDNSLGQSDDMSKWETRLADTWMKRVLN